MAEPVCRSEKLAMSKASECLPKLIQLGLSLVCFPTDCNIFVTCMYSFCSKNKALHFIYIYIKEIRENSSQTGVLMLESAAEAFKIDKLIKNKKNKVIYKAPILTRP